MPRLIQKIEGELLNNFNSEVKTLSIKAVLGTEDYFKVFGLEGFLQNFTRVEEFEEYNMNSPYGLIINNNKEFEELNINY